MTTTFNNEQDLIDFFNFSARCHFDMRYWLRNSLLYVSTNHPIWAGVLVGFHFSEKLQDYEIILTQRSANLAHHSNQVSFPGGKAEANDKTISDTAIRETREEIGIPREYIRAYRLIKKIKSPTNYVVYPTLAIIDIAPQDQNKNISEVTEIFTLPCSLLLNPKQYYFKKYLAAKSPFKLVHLKYAGKHIWGLTAEILYFLAKNYIKYKKQDGFHILVL